MINLVGNCQSLTIDVSLIFNKYGYIDECICKYTIDDEITHVILTRSINSSVKICDYFLLDSYNFLFIMQSKKLIY